MTEPGWAGGTTRSAHRGVGAGLLQGMWTLVVTTAAIVVGLGIARVDIADKRGLVAGVAFVVALEVVLAGPLRRLAVRGSVLMALFLGFGAQVAVVAFALRLAAGDALPLSTTLLVLFVAACILALGRWLTGATDSGYIAGGATVRTGRRVAAQRGTGPSERGLLVVMLDGVALPTLRRAIAGGQAPNLARWIATSHHLTGWWATIPSTTPAGIAGLLYGNRADIPGFRWWDRRTGTLLAASSPRASALVESRLAQSGGLLRGGTAISSTYTGGAARSYLVISTATGVRRLGSGAAYLPFFARPFLLPGALMLTVGEMIKELYQGRRQRVRRVEPRIARRGAYVALRGLTNVLLRKLNLSLVAEEMAAGSPVIFVDFVDYDEIAHHAGPERPEAMRAIEGLDGVLAALEGIARRVSTEYELVVLSDHGQSLGRTFADLTGETFPQLVDRLLADDAPGTIVAHPVEGGEDWAPINALLSTLLKKDALSPDRLVAVDTARPVDDTEAPEVVVTAGGNIGSIWFPRQSRRPSLTEIAAMSPRLVPGLLATSGIGLVMATDDGGRPVVLGHSGARGVGPGGEVTGTDPLAGFPSRTADDLARLHALPDTGDVVVLSAVDEDGNVHALEQQVGSHGGVGGGQNHGMFVYPRRFGLDPEFLEVVPELGDQPVPVGPWALHHQLCQWRRSWVDGPAM